MRSLSFLPWGKTVLAGFACPGDNPWVSLLWKDDCFRKKTGWSPFLILKVSLLERENVPGAFEHLRKAETLHQKRKRNSSSPGRNVYKVYILVLTHAQCCRHMGRSQHNRPSDWTRESLSCPWSLLSVIASLDMELPPLSLSRLLPLTSESITGFPALL